MAQEWAALRAPRQGNLFASHVYQGADACIPSSLSHQAWFAAEFPPKIADVKKTSVPSLRGGREASQVASQNGEFWTKDGSLQDGGSLTVVSSKAVRDLCSNLVASFQIDPWHDYPCDLRHAHVEIQVAF